MLLGILGTALVLEIKDRGDHGRGDQRHFGGTKKLNQLKELGGPGPGICPAWTNASKDKCLAPGICQYRHLSANRFTHMRMIVLKKNI